MGIKAVFWNFSREGNSQLQGVKGKNYKNWHPGPEN